jgi:hypothetical protein
MFDLLSVMATIALSIGCWCCWAVELLVAFFVFSWGLPDDDCLPPFVAGSLTVTVRLGSCCWACSYRKSQLAGCLGFVGCFWVEVGAWAGF